MQHMILGSEGNWTLHISQRRTRLPSPPDHPSLHTIHKYTVLTMITMLVIVNYNSRKFTREKTGSSQRASVWWIGIFLFQIFRATARWSGWSSCQMLSLVAMYRNQCGRNASHHVGSDPGRPGRSTLWNLHAHDLSQISPCLSSSSSPPSISSLSRVTVPWPLAHGWRMVAAAVAWCFWVDVLRALWVVVEHKLVGALLTLHVNIHGCVTFTGGWWPWVNSQLT